MKKTALEKTSRISQIVGGVSSFLFVILNFFGITQTQFPSVIGITYNITDTPFKVILYFSLGIIAILSFLVAYVAYKSSKKKRK